MEFFKTIGIVLLAIIVLINLFIVLSGRFYLYKGIANTYLKGKSGPDIYDLEVFPYSTIEKAEKSFKWDESSQYNQYSFSSEEQKVIDKTKTTAFLVFQNDSLLFERYYEKHAVGTISNSFSAAKTIVGLLIGIALDEGKIKSLDELVLNYIPEFETDDKKEITIRHLLHMASGLNWGESGINPVSENAESYYGTDLYGLSTRQKGIKPPGEKFNYQSGNSQLLAFILKKATGKNISAYAEEKLWKRIGTAYNAHWSLDKKGGDEKAFCCLYATAQDFGRIGRLILNYGEWNGEQIISKEYMKSMMIEGAPMTEDDIVNTCYASHIWKYNDDEDNIFYCRGILGQYIAVIPSKNLVFIRLGHERIDGLTHAEFIRKKARGEQVFEKNIDQPIDFLAYVKMVKNMLK